MNRGVPPTARNARTGELTPPGMTAAGAVEEGLRRPGASSGPGQSRMSVTAQPILSAGRIDRSPWSARVRPRCTDASDPRRLAAWSVRSCPSRCTAPRARRCVNLVGEIDMLTATRLPSAVNKILTRTAASDRARPGRRDVLRLAGPGHAGGALPQGEPRAERPGAGQRRRLPSARARHHRAALGVDDPQRDRADAVDRPPTCTVERPCQRACSSISIAAPSLPVGAPRAAAVASSIASVSARRCSSRSRTTSAWACELPVLVPQVDEDRDLGPQHPRVERLGEVVDRAGGVAAQRQVGVAVGGGQEDDRDVPRPLPAFDVAGPSRTRPSRASGRPAGSPRSRRRAVA